MLRVHDRRAGKMHNTDLHCSHNSHIAGMINEIVSWQIATVELGAECHTRISQDIALNVS